MEKAKSFLEKLKSCLKREKYLKKGETKEKLKRIVEDTFSPEDLEKEEDKTAQNL
jgi:arsenate reductase-like glutaredoxin family protein